MYYEPFAIVIVANKTDIMTQTSGPLYCKALYRNDKGFVSRNDKHSNKFVKKQME